MPENWLIPDWPVPAGVHALCSTRAGGCSLGPYAGLNLGDHVGDAPDSVAANRAAFARAMGARPLFLNQIHGIDVAAIDEASADGIAADAALTEKPGLACTVMVADCLPVLFCDRRGLRVAAAHAGWRGLVGVDGTGVLEQTVRSLLMDNPGADSAADLLVWLGPCIGPVVFEVGSEVRDPFVAHDAAAAQRFRLVADGKWLADLAGLARLRLRALGISQIYGNDSSAAWCTVGNASRFFSYRRDRVCGRFAASIWRQD